MIAVIARIPVQEGKEAEFEKAFSSLVSAVQENEPGNILYRLCKEKGSSTYTVIETYRDQESLNAHGKSEHFKAGGKAFGHLMAGKPEIEMLEVVAG